MQTTVDSLANDGALFATCGESSTSRRQPAFLEARHQAATARVEFRPPTVIIIAEIENIGHAGLDWHLLSDGEVIDFACDDGVIDGSFEIRVNDDMRIGAADGCREPRPFGADAGKTQAGRIDQPDGFAELAPQFARSRRAYVLSSPQKGVGLRLRLASAKV